MPEAPLQGLRLSPRQESLLRLIRRYPGSRGHTIIIESNHLLGDADPKKTSSGWGALASIHNRSLVRSERSKGVGPGPYAVKYWITAEGRTALDRADKRKEKLCPPQSLTPLPQE